ncbi:MAG: AAA family ATPase [Deltaproteobacteria bacterium]|jgi:hypothetical protein|nr:AAA family ATPase [Deltaproteobacteria bacterium]
MLEEMKILAEAGQPFGQLIAGARVYVDKTKQIYDLIAENKFCRLARPDGFGKSLIISTMEEIFSGNRELFKNTWIGGSDFAFQSKPIILIDFKYRYVQENRLIEFKTKKLILNRAKEEGFKIKYLGNYDALTKLISFLATKYQQKVVILLDNFEAPLLQNLDDSSVFNANSEILNGLLASLTSSLHSIDFVFIASAWAIHDILENNEILGIQDLSLEPKFNAICGFTRDELSLYFKRHLVASLNLIIKSPNNVGVSNLEQLKDKIERLYGGYVWGQAETIINPTALFRFFANGSLFKPYGPSLAKNPGILSLVRYYPWEFLQPISSPLTSEAFSQPGSPQMALFQAGHLTFDLGQMASQDPDQVSDPGARELKLQFANDLVYSRYYPDLWQAVSNSQHVDIPKESEKFLIGLIRRNEQEIESVFAPKFQDLFSYIDYENYSRPDKETYLTSFLKFYFHFIGILNLHRADYLELHNIIILWLTNKKYVIIMINIIEFIEIAEFGSHKDRVRLFSRKLAESISQIRELQLLDPFRQVGSIGLALAVDNLGNLKAQFVREEETS